MSFHVGGSSFCMLVNEVKLKIENKLFVQKPQKSQKLWTYNKIKNSTSSKANVATSDTKAK